MALGLVLGVAGLTSLDGLRCSIVPARACRIVETYRKAPAVGFLSRIALSLSDTHEKHTPRDKS
ncbi:MAG TPA: hypothetical protein VFL57_06480 [Bryobacteraceae bacterium]|nr:hypothetical protein [Bryobacteraceae bacterium]